MNRIETALLVCALALVALYVAVAGGGLPLDDSWIYQSAARTLATTGEWALLPGSAVAPFTSPLHTLMLAIGYRLGVAHLLWTHLLGALSLGLQALLLGRLASRYMPELPSASWLAGLLSLGTWQLVWAAASGMETALFCLLTTALLYFAWRQQPTDLTASPWINASAMGLLSGLTILARPEGAILVVLTMIARWAGGQVQRRRALAFNAMAALVCGSVIAPGVAFNLSQNGALLPATAIAKLTQFRALTELNLAARLTSAALPAIAGGQALLLPGVLAYLWMLIHTPHWRNARLWLPVAWIAALVFVYALLLPVGYHHGRYLIPALPPLILAGGIGLAHAQHRWKRTRFGRVVVNTWLMACLCCSAIFGLFIGPSIYRRDVAIVNEEMVEAAQWIARHIPLNAELAAHDIGAVAYFAERAPLDIAGLTDQEFLAVHADAALIRALLEKRGAQYLMAFPDQIPDEWDGRRLLCPVYVSDGGAAPGAGGDNMRVSRFAWDGSC